MLLALGCFLQSTRPATAQDCPYLFSRFRSAVKAQAILLNKTLKTENAAEVETALDDTLLGFMTTADGLVGSLFTTAAQKKIGPPAFLERLAKSKKLKNWEDLLWDDLDLGQKRKLLEHVSINRGVRFFKDREFHGLTVRKKIDVDFDEPTELFGVQYEAGPQQLDLDSFVMPKVEYQMVGDVEKKLREVELHVRSDVGAGDLNHDVWKLQKLLGLERTHLHIHITGKLPTKKLRDDPLAATAEFTELYRRANGAAEMLTILDRGTGISSKIRGSITFFDNLSGTKMDMVYNYASRIATGGDRIKLDTRARMAWAGFRGPETYDAKNLFGIEYRGISASNHGKNTRPLLNGINTAVVDFYKTPVDGRFQKWLETYHGGKLPEAPTKGDSVSKLLAAQWYDRDWNTVVQSMPEDLARKFKKIPKSYRDEIIKDRQKHQEIKMLLHDWSTDPVIFDNPALVAKVRELQLKCIARLSAAENPASIVGDFLEQSGLADAYFGSFVK